MNKVHCCLFVVFILAPSELPPERRGQCACVYVTEFAKAISNHTRIAIAEH